MNPIVLMILFIFVMVFGLQHVVARPNNRVKRVSDSHLANLETLLALSKIKRNASRVHANNDQFATYKTTKRISDTHLADLQTKIAMNNRIKGYAITMPVGAGQLDPYQIGRKRRSEAKILDTLFNQSDEDDTDPSLLNYEDLQYNYNYLY